MLLSPTDRGNRRWLLVLALPALVFVACNVLIPRQGWSPDYGPVVPHDTFPADCQLCHQGKDWKTLRSDFQFDHGKETGFELRGAHAAVRCLMCHNDRGPVRQFWRQGCGGCHEDVHRAQLGRLCADCHNENTWVPREQIERHNRTRFPLVGAHAGVACFRCHAGAQVGNFSGASPVCEHCHGADLARATNPDHAAQGWTTDCQHCHVPLSWQPARFAHPLGFPLTNGHAGITCSNCHQNGTFAGLSVGCSGCHLRDYTNAQNPNHPAAGFGTDCRQCHDTHTFATSTFVHPGPFSMTLGHAGRQCVDCHRNQVFAGTSSECRNCHDGDYQNAQNPNHVTAGFSHDCQQCHNTATWHGAVFAHAASFPLTNAHNIACNRCHTTAGVYTGLSPECASCHLQAYRAATNPDHTAFQLSQQCQNCHGTTAWQPSTFTHRFPITSGHHAGLQCYDCHDNAANRSLFSCTDCHTHSQATTDGQHSTVRNYVYQTSACYQCHPSGRS
jgi:hypothetical protein